MITGFIDIFEGICPPTSEPSDKPLYAVMPIPDHPRYFVGKDQESLACFLISTNDQKDKPHTPIRLENLDAQFSLRCHLRKQNNQEKEGVFTVIRCRDKNREIIRYFLSVCETILNVLGGKPTRAQITVAVNRLVAIFQRVRQPSTRTLNGLFGELFLLYRSRNPITALTAWRIDDDARFDFSEDDIRLDVKTSVSRSRQHLFSYEQCNPPSGTIAIVASLFADQAAGGVPLYSVINQIETQVSSNADLVFKLHETIATTLGTSLNESLSRRFDMRLAESSLRFFSLVEIPAIRGTLPIGVSNLHFRSDLSALSPVSIEALIDQDPKFWDLLPDGREVELTS